MLLSGPKGGGGGGREGGGGGGGVVVMRKQGTALGLSSLPRRVGSTLKRKLWDSNDLVSSTAGRWKEGGKEGGREIGKEGGRKGGREEGKEGGRD